MKEAHPELFGISLSQMVLRRYDGMLLKMNLAEQQPSHYLWWISVMSTKAVDELSSGTYQLAESARIPMIILFVDFHSNPEVEAKSTELLKQFEALEPEFNKRFIFFWTDNKEQLKNRRTLGITWDDLPAIAMNSLDHIVFAYPQDEPMERTHLNRWLS